MKQIFQSLRSGVASVEDIPCPATKSGHLLIRTRVSLVSAGTERMLVEFGRANLLEKARQQPDKVLMVLDKMRTDGFFPTIEAVWSKLDQNIPLGYCNAGEVIEVGEGVTDFKVGDRVASNGNHAEIVCVPQNLCAKIPNTVNDEAASFTVLGAIALQGVRLAQPSLGESVVVTGLGLVGLLTVQLLRAQGCRVLGIDYDSSRIKLAKMFGATTVDLSAGEDPLAAALVFSRGRGVDAVVIAASTDSNEPIRQAAKMCRKKGRIVLVGVTGLQLSRADFFEKELTFQVSCSYGPGRYDAAYEEGGQDYPFGYVRWTAQRNFEAILDMFSEKHLDINPFISHRFTLNDAASAYQLLANKEYYLGILLNYPDHSSQEEFRRRTIQVTTAKSSQCHPEISLGFVGSGNYASRILIPAFQKTGVNLKSISSIGGLSGLSAAKKFNFENATTDNDSLINDPQIDTVVIATRHDSHAKFVCQALKQGKNVFVEKPLAINKDELHEIESIYNSKLHGERPPLLMVGFNRRFSPHIQKIKQMLLAIDEPKCFIMTVNAGNIPSDHWTQNLKVGGGRIVGEGCHFVDLLRFLAGSPIISKCEMMVGDVPGLDIRSDKASFTLGFENGSIGTVHYIANGHRSFPKERLEVFCGGRILQLDNFIRLRGYGWNGFKKMNLWKQDKGQENCVASFIGALRNGETAPIPFEELIEVSRVSITIMDSLLAGRGHS